MESHILFKYLADAYLCNDADWMRELSKWAPHLRAVPYYGRGKSKHIIRQYELLHPGLTQKTSGLKAHIILTTYEGITSREDFKFLKAVPRWEMLVVDEAQKLKNDTNLIFKYLNELTIAHRVLLTGTPLNNTIREVLNLLNFLDKDNWKDLDELENWYNVTEDGATLQEARYKELREKLKPYMLRRRKDEVLNLPPKVRPAFVCLLLTAQRKLKHYTILSERGHSSDDDETAAKAGLQVHPGKGFGPHEAHVESSDAK